MKLTRSRLLQDINTAILKGDTQETAQMIELGLKNNLSSQVYALYKIKID